MTALYKLFWVCVENVLVRVEEASRSGHSKNRLELASSGVSFVLGMALQSQTSRRTEACQQRGSRPDLPYGCRESDLGSAAHSWRTTEAGFRSWKEVVPGQIALPITSLPSMPKYFAAPKRDRKSTRLNSSHVAISYAVFCLKKKKPLPTTTPSSTLTSTRTSSATTTTSFFRTPFQTLAFSLSLYSPRYSSLSTPISILTCRR